MTTQERRASFRHYVAALVPAYFSDVEVYKDDAHGVRVTHPFASLSYEERAQRIAQQAACLVREEEIYMKQHKPPQEQEEEEDA